MRKLFRAALIVTIFSVLTRALGFVLKIILSRKLGAEMLGHYQVAMSIFGVLMTLVASGLPLVVSRTVAYKKTINDDKGAYSSVTAGLVVTLTISVAVSVVIWAFPELLNLIFRQNNTTSIVLLTLPGLIASAIYCVLRSALWGNKHFFAISFTEFFEQIVRIVLCFILFSGAILPNMDLGDKAALSLSLACIASATLVVIIYFGLKYRLASPKGALKPLLKSSTPITGLRTVSSLVSSLIALIIPLRLRLYGYTASEAMAQFGMATGMALPLITIPGTLISSLAVTLVPEISSKTDNIDDKSKTRDLAALKSHIKLGINLSTLISLILFPAFFVLGRPISQLLFGSAEPGKYISAAAILMLPQGISQITSSMLNSIGLELKSLKNYAVGAVFLFLSIFFLPKYIGTYAMVVGMTALSTTTAIMNLAMLKKRGLIERGYPMFVACCLTVALVSSLAGYMVHGLLTSLISGALATILSAIIITIIMLTLAIIFNLAGIRGFLVVKKKKKHSQKATLTN